MQSNYNTLSQKNCTSQPSNYSNQPLTSNFQKHNIQPIFVYSMFDKVKDAIMPWKMQALNPNCVGLLNVA